jgi:hypothetical protein
MEFLLVSFTSLTWWQMILWVVYAIYFIYRTYRVFDDVNQYGLRKGYQYSFIGYYKRDLKLYHVARMLFDIPPMILGLFFPIFKRVLNFRIYTFKEEKK